MRNPSVDNTSKAYQIAGAAAGSLTDCWVSKKFSRSGAQSWTLRAKIQFSINTGPGGSQTTLELADASGQLLVQMVIDGSISNTIKINGTTFLDFSTYSSGEGNTRLHAITIRPQDFIVEFLCKMDPVDYAYVDTAGKFVVTYAGVTKTLSTLNPKANVLRPDNLTVRAHTVSGSYTYRSLFNISELTLD
jgi:hypothetical protein